MDPLRKLGTRERTESEIQRALRRELLLGGWYTLQTHGNANQAGFPDVLALHRRWGVRWVEVKRPGGVRFTQAQLDVFTAFSSRGVGVWVVTGEDQVRLLHGPANWHTHLMSSSRGIVLRGEPKRIKKWGPEAAIQDSAILKLTSPCGCGADCRTHTLNNWYCLETYGSAYQSGLPDVFACHRALGQRWIEFKNPAGYKFTPAQSDVFPRFAAEGVGIWILDGHSDAHLSLLNGPAQWHTFMWPSR